MKNNKIYRQLLLSREQGKKMLAVLIDPAKVDLRDLASLIAILKNHTPDYIFIGGSHAIQSVDNIIEILKEEINTPIILFPGDASQFSKHADAILYLSLLSGRNPEYLIGQHIKSADAIKACNIEVIPTAYILIDGGKVSSVEYISNTKPIPSDKKDIIASTAIAGELLGMQLTYLEAGSGALHPVPAAVISHLRNTVSLPIVVGGGICDIQALESVFDAGADLVVIGNVFEEDPMKMQNFIDWTKNYNLNAPTHTEKFKHPDIL